LNFDLCQRCFLVGRVCKSHKITHPIKEYASGSTDTFKDFTLIVRNRLRSKDRFRRQNSNPEEVLSTPPPVTGGNASWRNTWTPKAQPIYMSQSSQPPLFPVDQVRLNGTAPPTPQANRSAKGDLAAGRPVSIGDSRRKRDAGGDNLIGAPTIRQRPARQYTADVLSPSAEQEHELIAKYSQSLRRQSTPNLAASAGMQSQFTARESALSRAPTCPNAYDAYYSTQISGAGWQGGVAMTWDRHTGNLLARPPPPPPPPPDAVFRGARENPLVLYNLEEENRFLRAEYERLKLHSPNQALRPLRSPSLQQQPPHGPFSPSDDRFQAYPTFPVGPNRVYVQDSGSLPVQSGYGQQMQQLSVLPSQLDRGASSGLLYGGSLGRASTAHVGTRGWERSTFELGRLPANTCYVGQDPALGYEMVNEARLLRQHKSRLESRMQLLEDHNRQLEDQLSRLRQYLNLNTLAPAHANSRSLVVPENPPLLASEHQSFDPIQQLGLQFTRHPSFLGQQQLPLESAIDQPSHAGLCRYSLVD
uniref:C2H2-type domain-containing protein n=1 Tax=Schistocephalus solidus TaxID=70667 RepID=A0A183SVU5_SCHSO